MFSFSGFSARGLSDLRAGEFIYEQPAVRDVGYVFKHALTHEVAYNSLLIESRKQLHEHAGHALDSIFAQHLDDHLSELARHYSHSDNPPIRFVNRPPMFSSGHEFWGELVQCARLRRTCSGSSVMLIAPICENVVQYSDGRSLYFGWHP
jgi:hypothetical protein